MKDEKKFSFNQLIHILLKVKFFPMKYENFNLKFSFFNCDVITHFFSFYLSTVSTYFIATLLFMKSLNRSEFDFYANLSLTDTLTYLGFNISNFVTLPLLPLIVAKAAMDMSDTCLITHAKWPEMGKKGCCVMGKSYIHKPMWIGSETDLLRKNLRK